MPKKTAVDFLMGEYLAKLGKITVDDYKMAERIEKQQFLHFMEWIIRHAMNNPQRLKIDNHKIVEEYYSETFTNSI